ncbi:Uu.00g027140.m01.CDS01 [Anthostomella pinea]|uniref:Uu.00g027140.m01.CDS01 n=1 Tax=Anthostomella pinea TaxID=933095 RepID=A0AAI8YCK6_9PEZI|nr:Uu.00g027140.m01.CDS01 [Anthostomella pinea]
MPKYPEVPPLLVQSSCTAVPLSGATAIGEDLQTLMRPGGLDKHLNSVAKFVAKGPTLITKDAESVDSLSGLGLGLGLGQRGGKSPGIFLTYT